MARVHEPHELKVGVVGCGRMGCAIAGKWPPCHAGDIDALLGAATSGQAGAHSS